MVARFVLLLVVAASPVAGVAVVGASTTRLEAVAARQQADRQPVDAVLLEDAERPADSTAAPGVPVLVPVRARWSAATDVPPEGTVLAAAGTRTGATLHVWLGPDGEEVAPPMDPRDVAGLALLRCIPVLIAVPLVAWALYAGLAAALDAHRARRWEREWAAVEPTWRSRST